MDGSTPLNARDGAPLHPLGADYLQQLVPGLAASDVYVCGPVSYTDTIIEAVRDIGVPEHRIHHEFFTF